MSDNIPKAPWTMEPVRKYPFLTQIRLKRFIRKIREERSDVFIPRCSPRHIVQKVMTNYISAFVGDGILEYGFRLHDTIYDFSNFQRKIRRRGYRVWYFYPDKFCYSVRTGCYPLSEEIYPDIYDVTEVRTRIPRP